jgi:hypothetical protein
MNPILVLGPGRCGTSMVAGILHYLGVCMGEIFIPADTTNPFGHWEDAEIHDLNVAYLSKQMREEVWEKCLLRIFDDRQTSHLTWGWKDPRMCYLVHHIAGLYTHPTYIRCERDRYAMQKSAEYAYGWSARMAHETFSQRNTLLDDFLYRRTHLVVDFEKIKEDPQQVVRQIVDFCGLRPNEEQFRIATSFIDTEALGHEVCDYHGEA